MKENVMKSHRISFRGHRTARRGSLTLELMLIFPIVLLILFLFFQMTVVLMTWHSLHAAVTFAGNVAAEETGAAAKTAVDSACTGWYFAKNGNNPLPVKYCTLNTEWNDASNYFKIRVLSRGTVATPAAQWSYVGSGETIPADTVLRVELKLCDMSDHFPQYWLVGQFQGVDTDTARDSITVSNTVIHQ